MKQDAAIRTMHANKRPLARVRLDARRSSVQEGETRTRPKQRRRGRFYWGEPANCRGKHDRQNGDDRP